MKTRYIITTTNGTLAEITTSEPRKDYLVSTFNYVVVSEDKIPSCSDFNGTYEAGKYIDLLQNTQGDWTIGKIFTLSKSQELEFTSFIISSDSALEKIYKTGSKILGYKTFNGAKKALMNKINPALKF